jgi:hypothetical protein
MASCKLAGLLSSPRGIAAEGVVTEEVVVEVVLPVGRLAEVTCPLYNRLVLVVA